MKKEALSLACPPPQAEGYESSGTQTPKTKAGAESRGVPKDPQPLRSPRKAVSDGSSSESGGGSEQMERVFSLSALDALLQETRGTELRLKPALLPHVRGPSGEGGLTLAPAVGAAGQAAQVHLPELGHADCRSLFGGEPLVQDRGLGHGGGQLRLRVRHAGPSDYGRLPPLRRLQGRRLRRLRQDLARRPRARGAVL